MYTKEEVERLQKTIADDLVAQRRLLDTYTAPQMMRPDVFKVLNTHLDFVERIRHVLVDHELLQQYFQHKGYVPYYFAKHEILSRLEKNFELVEGLPNTFLLQHDMLQLIDYLRALPEIPKQ